MGWPAFSPVMPVIQLGKKGRFLASADPAGSVAAFDMLAHNQARLVAVCFGYLAG